jgi:hypothetical protein
VKIVDELRIAAYWGVSVFPLWMTLILFLCIAVAIVPGIVGLARMILFHPLGRFWNDSRKKSS